MFYSHLTQKEQLRHYFLKHAIFYRHVQNKNSATMHKKINNSNRFDIHRLLSSLQEVVHTSQKQQFFLKEYHLYLSQKSTLKILTKFEHDVKNCYVRTFFDNLSDFSGKYNINICHIGRKNLNLAYFYKICHTFP